MHLCAALELIATFSQRKSRKRTAQSESSNVTLFLCLTGHGMQARILICSHSIIFWDSKREASSRSGTRAALGTAVHIEWLRRWGMRWNQFLPALTNYLNSNPAPDLLIMHLGENDLCTIKGVKLRFSACHDLATIQGWLPDCIIGWSEFLHWRVWRGAHICLKIEKREERLLTKSVPLSNAWGPSDLAPRKTFFQARVV